MVNKDKIADELAEAVELTDVSVDTDIPSQERNHRETELHGWDEEQARKTASEEGIELTDEHLRVVRLLRDYYRKHGAVQTGRELGDMLDSELEGQGGRKYLHRLFPDGPVAQGMRIAGLPVPAHSEDGGFGTAR